MPGVSGTSRDRDRSSSSCDQNVAVNGFSVHSDILITGAHKHSSAAFPGQARAPGNRTQSISLASSIVRRNERR